MAASNTTTSASSPPLKEVPEVKAVSTANTAFSVDLFNGLKEQFPANLIYSPFSLSAVVAMVQVGARGETASEIATVFRYPTDMIALGKGYGSVLASLQTTNEGYTLSSANRLYTNVGFRIKSDYSKAVKDHFLAEVEQLDFAQNVASAGTINAWVEETTHGKIKDLIPPDALIGASLILVNGIYFKGLWSRQFKTTDTKKAPFFLGEKDAVNVDMMSQTSKFLYGTFDDVGAHAVALPYKGERLSMIIIAPKEKTGLSRVEEGLKKYTPQAIFDNLYATEKVIVRLPRFRIESTMPLVPSLRMMGLSAMFTGRADFSGIPQDGEQLVVTEVIQKAFIEVNEEGSEAAAATAIRMARCAPPMCDMPTEFNADRPFIFQIVDRQTNFVLFAGRCNNPLLNK